MIEPLPCARIGGMTRRARRKWARTLMCQDAVHAVRLDLFERPFDLDSGMAVEDVDPAEISERTAHQTVELDVVANVRLDRQRPPAGGDDAARGLPAAAGSRSATTRVAPSRAIISAPARPMPEPAPVTIATRPCRIMLAFPDLWRR